MGVLADDEIRLNIGIDPCRCGAPDAGSCDAGSPDAAPALAPTTCFEVYEGYPVSCVTYQNTIAGIAPLACPPFMQTVPSCPNLGSVIGCCSLPATPHRNDTCYYTFGPGDPGDYSSYQTACTGFENGIWTWGPAGAGSTGDPSNSDAGVDAGSDAAVTPHC